MAIYRGLGGAGSNEQDASVSVITTKALEAATSATNAATSASAASTSASNAATSETNAAASATAAEDARGEALLAQTAAASSATDSENSATDAETAATIAVGAQTSAAASEGVASTSATNAAASAASALAIYGNTTAMNNAVAAAAASESAAATSETNAASSASAASNSETNAANSASSAASSATSASTSAGTATTKASEALTSASNAAASASAAAASETAAGASETAAAASESAAATSASNAASSASSASSSASTATTKASEAAASESAAATSASNAATSATNASNSAAAAAASETNAVASASAASASEAAAAASFDAFDDRYLGDKTSDPSVDNDGNALLTGALYFDSVTGVMKVWSGTNWIAAYASLSGAMFASNNLSDVSSIPTARSNLGLGTAAVEDVSAFITPNSTATLYSLTTTDGLEVGGALVVTGNLTVNGTTTTIDTTNLAVEDNMIYLNAGSAVTNPDLGIAGNYNDGSYAHAGFFRDATDGRWKPFDGYTPEPDESPEIDTSHASFSLGDIQAGTFFGALVGNADTATLAATATNVAYSGLTGTVPTWNQNTTGNAATANYATTAGTANAVPYGNLTGTVPTWNQNTTGNAATATKLATARTIGLSGDVSGSVSFDGSANATITAVVADDSHNHIISNVDGLQAALDSKQPTGAYLTGNQTITLSGDVSGSGTTSISVTVADDSHNHIISNVDGLQAALNGKAPLTGSGASGTWGINITGNAATASSATTAGSATSASSATTAGSASQLSTGTWTVTESGGVLYFAVSGSNKAKLDSSGNLTVVGNVTAYGSV
jgi:hypothetical protein